MNSSLSGGILPCLIWKTALVLGNDAGLDARMCWTDTLSDM